MMKKVFPAAVLFLVICIAIAGCSSATNGNPNEVLQAFFEHLAKKDIDGASKYVTTDSKATMEMMKKGLKMAENMKDSLPQNDPMKDFQDVSFSTARIAGDSAFITVSSKSQKRPDAEFKLLKENSGWKVDFSMTTLMRMGQKTMATGSDQVADSLNITKDQVEKSIKTADSILKNMDPGMLEEIQKKLEKLK